MKILSMWKDATKKESFEKWILIYFTFHNSSVSVMLISVHWLSDQNQLLNRLHEQSWWYANQF